MHSSGVRASGRQPENEGSNPSARFSGSFIENIAPMAKKQVKACPDVRITQGLVSRLLNGDEGSNPSADILSVVYEKQRSDNAETGKPVRLAHIVQWQNTAPQLVDDGSIPFVSFLR